MPGFPCLAREHIDFAAIQWQATIFVAFLALLSQDYLVYKMKCVFKYSDFRAIPIETDLRSLHIEQA